MASAVESLSSSVMLGVGSRYSGGTEEGRRQKGRDNGAFTCSRWRCPHQKERLAAYGMLHLELSERERV